MESFTHPLPGLGHLPTDRTLIMGIVNVTPDSFSDGGRWSSHEAAVARANAMVEAGADIIDVGGESTRPGSQRITSEQELGRVLRVVQLLVAAGITVSVDTIHAATAAACIDSGAAIINDVSGGLADPLMGRVIATAGRPVAYVCQHWRGTPETMDQLTDYGHDVTGMVLSELDQRVSELVELGVDPESIVLDPGLGFAKTPTQCWRLLAELHRFTATGHPVLVGASRKRFLASVSSPDPQAINPATARDAATAAVSALAARAGAWAVRVHEVPANLDAVRVANAWKEQE